MAQNAPNRRPYLTSPNRLRRIGDRLVRIRDKVRKANGNCSNEIRARAFAHPLIELATLFLTFGLDVRNEDMQKAVGRRNGWLKQAYGGQRDVLTALIGQEKLEHYESLILRDVELAREQLMRDNPPPPRWHEYWDEIKRAAARYVVKRPGRGGNHIVPRPDPVTY